MSKDERKRKVECKMTRERENQEMMRARGKTQAWRIAP